MVLIVDTNLPIGQIPNLGKEIANFLLTSLTTYLPPSERIPLTGTLCKLWDKKFG